MFSMDLKQLLCALMVCCLCLFVNLGHALEGRVMKVKDGDTVVISPEHAGINSFTCRLYGIDAPETAHGEKAAQPFGEEASNALKHMIFGEIITVIPTGAKTYGRDVCRLSKGSMDINLELVKRGYAWAYREYLKGPYVSEYISAETDARENKRGLWIERNPLPPWEFRKSGHR